MNDAKEQSVGLLEGGFQTLINATAQWEDMWLFLCKNKDIVLRAFLLPATDEWESMRTVEDMKRVEGIPDFPEPLPVLFVEGIERPTVAFSYTMESTKVWARECLEGAGMTVPESLSG